MCVFIRYFVSKELGFRVRCRSSSVFDTSHTSWRSHVKGQFSRLPIYRRQSHLGDAKPEIRARRWASAGDFRDPPGSLHVRSRIGRTRHRRQLNRGALVPAAERAAAIASEYVCDGNKVLAFVGRLETLYLYVEKSKRRELEAIAIPSPCEYADAGTGGAVKVIFDRRAHAYAWVTTCERCRCLFADGHERCQVSALPSPLARY
jgi:hypothetical protein